MSGSWAYIRSVIPTPEHVLPIIECAVPSLVAALRQGAEYADDLQPDPVTRESVFWSHSARFRARGRLLSAERVGWGMSPRIANMGIHLHFEGLHTARVLRSLHGSSPHAGSNRARQTAWTLEDARPFLPLGSLVSGPLTLILDWTRDEDDGIVLNAGLPRRAGSYPNGANLHWRVRVTGDADSDLANTEFDGNDPDGSARVIRIDPNEKFGSGDAT